MIDASIYRGIQQPQAPDQMAQYGRMMQIRNMMDQGELAGLQRNKLVKDMASEEAFRNAFDAYDPTNHATTIGALYKADPLRAADFESKRADIASKQATTSKNAAETLRTNMSVLRDQAAKITDDASLGAYRDNVARVLGPQFASRIPQTYTPEFVQSEIMNADELLKRNKPEYKQVDIGGTVQMVDMNPFTNPAIASMVLNKTMTPGEAATDRRGRESNAEQRRHNLVTEAQGAAGGRTYDADRGVVVNTRDGTASPVTMGGQPIQGKLTDSQKKELQGIDAQANTVDAAIRAVTQTPGAFSATRGLATMAGTLPEAAANAMSDSDQINARSFVFNVVSKVINERAGAAQSAQELARLRSFLPAEVDDARVIKDKLEGFKNYLAEQRKAFATPTTAQLPASAQPRQSQTFDALPDPAKFAGKRFEADDGSGAVYRSDGKKWVREAR